MADGGIESGREAENRRAVWAHVLPFAMWVFLLHMLGDPAGWKYAVISATGLALFVGLRPWQGYPGLQARNLPAALVTGVVVFAVWIGPETEVFGQWPRLQDFYYRWAVLPLGRLPEPLKTFPYAPETAGWPLALVRLAGSAFVIALIEEFFWRGFAYRWLLAADFRSVDLGRMQKGIFLAVAVAFGLEHTQWLVGIAAGLAYGYLVIRTRDIWAGCAAHALTNFLLGVYVLATGRYAFW